MKESYVKPMILFESFALTQTIARQCSGGDPVANSNHYSENTGCSYDVGGITVFYDPFCELDMHLEEGSDITLDEILDEFGVCYNNPENGYQVFSST